MTLFDQAVDLQLRLEANQTAESTHDLVEKADNLANVLEGVITYLDGVLAFRERLSLDDKPAVDVKASSTAVRQFRAGLSTHGAKAFQQQPAAKLVDVAKDQRTRASRWVSARWKAQFDPSIALIDAVEAGLLVGGSPYRRTAERVARKMTMLMRQNPVSDESKVVAELCGGDPDLLWPDQIVSLADELSQAFEAMRRERDALTPAVQSALDEASSLDGFPLEDLTSDLLEQIRAAGMAGDMVVRRR